MQRYEIDYIMGYDLPRDEGEYVKYGDAKIEIDKLENAIRKHRDEKGDDRCWMDDEELYKILPEGYTAPKRESCVELENCKKYIATRHNPNCQYVSPQRRIEELEKAIKDNIKQFKSIQSGTVEFNTWMNTIVRSFNALEEALNSKKEVTIEEYCGYIPQDDFATPPKTVVEAVNKLVAWSEPFIEDIKCTPIAYQINTQWLRNNWGMWQKRNDSPLKEDAIKQYNIAHADDISGLICAWAQAIIREEKFSPKEHCKIYHEHWDALGTTSLIACGELL